MPITIHLEALETRYILFCGWTKPREFLPHSRDFFPGRDGQGNDCSFRDQPAPGGLGRLEMPAWAFQSGLARVFR